MTKLSELKKDYWKILLYGPVGRGKTALALTLGEEAQVLDMDDGLMTGLGLKDSFYKARTSVDVLQFLEKGSSSATAFARARASITRITNEAVAGRYPFKYFILDSYTALAEAAVRYVMFNDSKLGEAPQIQHWGMAFVEIKNVMLLLRVMPLTVVMIAHEQCREVDKRPLVEIATPGQKMPHEIPRYFDEVWRMMLKNLAGGKVAYVVQTKGTATVTARSRSNLPTDTNTEIGMPSLLGLLRTGGLPS